MARGQHAFFVHECLRDSALADPLLFIWAAHRDDASERFANIWQRCAAAGDAADPVGLAVEVAGTGPLYVVVVSLPTPIHPIEAWFAAAAIVIPDTLLDEVERDAGDVPAKDRLERALKVVVTGTTEEARAAWNVPVRFFTLEHSLTVDGSPRTVLGEWQAAATGAKHLNHGDGPDASVGSFLQAIVVQLDADRRDEGDRGLDVSDPSVQ